MKKVDGDSNAGVSSLNSKSKSGTTSNFRKRSGTIVDQKTDYFKIGYQKGPNAPLPVVDNLMKTVTPLDWKNIPPPIIDAVKQLIDC